MVRAALVLCLCVGCGKVEGDGIDAGPDAPPICIPVSAVDGCNLADDDCDGEIDEDFVQPEIDFTFDRYESHWFTGSGANSFIIDWRADPPSVTCPIAGANSEGTATWSDPVTGDLLFFTGGSNLFDAAGNITPDGQALLGDPADVDSAVFVPVPGTDFAQLFLFTSNGADYHFSKVAAADGAVDVATKNTPIASGGRESMGVVEDGTGGFWLVLFDVPNTELDSYHIVDGTVPATPTISTPMPVADPGSTRAAIRFSRAGDRIAVGLEDTSVPQDQGGHFWAEFDKTTGTIVDQFITIDRHNAYSMAFSADGNFLYYPASPDAFGFSAAQLRQHHFDTGVTSIIEVPNTTFAGVGLAPDGNIYAFRQNQQTLHRIVDSNVGGVDNLELDAIDLGGCLTGFNSPFQIFLPSEAGCRDDSHCDDGDECTTDSCDLASGTCSSTCTGCP